MSESTNATETAVVLADDATGKSTAAIIESFQKSTGMVYSTIQGDDFTTKLKTIAATTNAQQLSDNIGTVINLKNFVLQAVIVNGENGPIEAIRSILIDDKGNAYASVASGVRQSLETICGVAGHPATWPKDSVVPVVATETKTRVGRNVVTLEYAGTTK